MRISYWSSDVCSSDLATQFFHHVPHRQALAYAIGAVTLATRVEDQRPLAQNLACQATVRGTDQVAGRGVFTDIVVSHVNSSRHLDGPDQGRWRRTQHLLGPPGERPPSSRSPPIPDD